MLFYFYLRTIKSSHRLKFFQQSWDASSCNYSVKILVINLERCEDRRAAMQQQLDRHCLEYDFFPAVDGSKGHYLFQRHDKNEALRRLSPVLTKGELGCWASHYLIWQHCVRIDESLLVLEDDILLEDGFPSAIELAQSLIKQYGYIRLFGIWQNSSKVLQTFEHYKLVKYRKGPSGTQAYAISPVAAKHLLEGAGKWNDAVDVYMDHYWLHGVECLAIKPYPVRVSDFASNMVDRGGNHLKSFGSKIRRELYRIRRRFRREKYVLCQVFSNIKDKMADVILVTGCKILGWDPDREELICRSLDGLLKKSPA